MIEKDGRLKRPAEWGDVARLVVHVCRCRRPAGRQLADHEDVVQDALYLALRRFRRLELAGALAVVPSCMVARYAVQDALSGRGFRLRGLMRRRRFLTGRALDRMPEKTASVKSTIFRLVPKGAKS